MNALDVINTPLPKDINNLMWLIILVGAAVIIWAVKLLIGAGKKVWDEKKDEIAYLKKQIEDIQLQRDASEKDTLATLGMLTEFLKAMKGTQASEKELILSKLQEAIDHIRELKG